MHGISMSQTGGVFHCAVIVYDKASVDDLILSVPVNIVYIQSMVALALVLGAAFLGIKFPVNIQSVAHAVTICILQIIGGEAGSCIISSCKHGKRSPSVQISHCGKETVHTSAVIISPGAHRTALRNIVRCIHNSAVISIKNSEIFRPAQNVTAAVAVIIF